MPMVRHLSIKVHTFNEVYLRSQQVNLDQTSLKLLSDKGKGCIMFSGRSVYNSGYHENTASSIDLIEEKIVCTRLA